MSVDARRARILACLGPLPGRLALDADIEPPLSTKAIIVRARVTYVPRPGERVSAWFCAPRGTAPADGWPGVLAIHQHANRYELGKVEPAGLAGDPQYAYGLELCRRGYVVLCPDLLCFEERRPAPAARWTTRATSASSLPGASSPAPVSGQIPARPHPRGGPARLHADGQWRTVGGHRPLTWWGLEALWLTWYDPRIALRRLVLRLRPVRTLLRDRINHGFAMYVPALLDTCDLDALVGDLAPRASC